MKFKLIRLFLVVLTSGFLLVSCDNTHPGFKKNDNGIYYQIVTNVDSTSHVKIDSGLFWRMSMSYGTPDSLLFDFKNNPQLFEMPYSAPKYKGDINEALALLSKGDSAVLIIKADSFFLKTAMAQEVPDMFKENNDLYFYVKIQDILTAEKLEAERQAKVEMRKALELADLTRYLSENYPDLEPTESGLFIVREKAGKGNLPKEGDFLNFDFKVNTLNGPLLYDSEAAGRPGETEKGKPFDTQGFTEGLNSMLVGEEATFIVPSKLAFKDQGRQGLIEPYTTMVYWVRLNSVKSKAQHDKEVAQKQAEEEAKALAMKSQEKVTIDNYLKQNNVTVAPTESGLYYIETAEGTGLQAEAGDKVKVHYSGTLLDGTKFDASYDRGEPYEFTLGKHQVIAGWDEGIALMKVGGKATLIVPSVIAYGERGRGGVIHPYAPLKFDVELVDVTKAEK